MAAKNSYCADAINTGVAARNLQPLLGALPAAVLWKVARDNYRKFCNQEPTPAPMVPYNGGQCPVGYEIGYSSTDKPSDDVAFVSSGSVRVWGPVLGFQYENSNDGITNGKYTVTCFGLFDLGPPSVVSRREEIARTIFPLSRNPILRATIRYIRRIDGQPDNCGNPPGSIPPIIPPPPSVNNNFTYIDNSGNNITVPLTFVAGFAFLDINGKLNVPIRVDINPDFDFPTTVSPSFTINFNVDTGDYEVGPTTYNDPNDPNGPGVFSPNPGGDSSPFNYGPGSPPPAPSSDAPPPLAPPPDGNTERVIRAVLVSTTALSSTATPTTLAQNVNPDVHVPDLGLVSFLIRTGGVTGGWTEDIRVKNKRQFIPCPWEGGAFDVQATPRRGVQFELTKIYGLKDVPVRN